MMATRNLLFTDRVLTIDTGRIRSLTRALAKKKQTDRRNPSGSVSESGSKSDRMAFGHEKPDVYRAAIEHVATEEYRTNQIDTDADADNDPERQP